MKRVLLVLILAFLFGCSMSADYTTEKFEEALNNREDVIGKTVAVEVKHLEDNEVFGVVIEAGNSLNFVTNYTSNVEVGDSIVVVVEEVVEVFGEFIILYSEE